MMSLRKKSSVITHGGALQNKIIKSDQKYYNNKDRVIASGKRKNFDEEEQKKDRVLVLKLDGITKRRRLEKNVGVLPSLPDELIENILTRSSSRTLALCRCVSKLWNNSIYNDTRFATSHYIHNQNKLSLFFSLLKPVDASDDRKLASIFGLETDEHDSDVLRFRTYSKIMGTHTTEIVGYCNGLACVKLGNKNYETGLVVINPTRGERLCLYCPSPSELIPLCYGFGFDSVSQEYKVVVISKKTIAPEITCMVFTLGTNSWRCTTVAEIPAPPGAYALPSQAGISISNNFCTSGTLCGLRLIWRITAHAEDNDKVEMLLSFDLHQEKLQFHQLPSESTLTPTNENEKLVVDHHLLEFKGYPCIARFEKIMISNCNHCCLSVFCSSCRCCKVHMYLLKDKEKWIKEEIFDVKIEDLKGLLPDTFRCHVDTSTTSTASTLPTRLLTFSDQLLLYWFDGDRLVFYNLQTKYLKVVKGTPAARGTQEDDNMYCTYMDYQLHAQVENFQSLKTFIPVENSYKFNREDDYYEFIKHKRQAGCLVTGKKNFTMYCFL